MKEINLECVITDEILRYSGYWFTNALESDRNFNGSDIKLYFVPANTFNNKKELKYFKANNPILHQVFEREVHDIQWRAFDNFRKEIGKYYIKTSTDEYTNVIDSCLNEGFVSFKYIDTEKNSSYKVIKKLTIKDEKIEINSRYDISNWFKVCYTYNSNDLYSNWSSKYLSDEILINYCNLWWR